MSPVLSGNNTVANMCHTKALAYKIIVAYSAPRGHSRNSSRSHVTWTLASRPFTLGTFSGDSLRNVATRSRHVEDSTRPMMSRHLIDNPKIVTTSLRVTVISPHGRWKESVSSLHLSTIIVMVVALNTGMPGPMMLVIDSKLACRRRGM
jgi:hypothetical protein